MSHAVTARVIPPVDLPEPPRKPARRKGAGGRWEVLVAGAWLPEGDPATPLAVARAQAHARAIEDARIRSLRPAAAPTARQREVWDAVRQHGTQVAAAKALRTSQGSIQSALAGYMERMGISGPLPGKLPPPSERPKPRRLAPMHEAADATSASPSSSKTGADAGYASSIPEPSPAPAFTPPDRYVDGFIAGVLATVDDLSTAVRKAIRLLEGGR